MYYFYYFLDSSKLYYGGITNSIPKRQTKHRSDHKNGLKSTTKDWHLLQDPITLIPVWTFETRNEAVAYEKLWILSNYRKPFCLNHIRNGGYDYKNHRAICEDAGGFVAKPYFIKTHLGVIALRATSTNDRRAQDFLGCDSSKISSLLNFKDLALFFRVWSQEGWSEEVYYLEYENEPLKARANRLGRSIEKDLATCLAFKTNLRIQSGTVTLHLQGYKSYTEAARLLGLVTKSDINKFIYMVTGKIKRVKGWSLVSDPDHTGG